jgi:ribosomal protein L29
MKEISDLKKLDSIALQKELGSARKGYAELIMQKSLGSLKQTHHISRQKKYIAQIMTFLRLQSL